MVKPINGISIICCCYNSAQRLPKTLAHLANQNISGNFNWELILVNNNSTDNTAEVALKEWSQLGAPVNLLLVNEPQAGLTYARERGINTAQFNLLLFCDDDNWLQDDYLNNVWLIFNIDPHLGALGGWSKAVFEGETPDWFDTFKGNFAVGKAVSQNGYLTEPQSFIYGAGMVINKGVIEHLKAKGFKQLLSDRRGTALSSGGDIELIYAMRLLGYKVKFNDTLLFYHFMPNERMTWEYLIKLRQSMYWSNFVLNIYIDALKNKPNNFLWLLKKAVKSIVYIYQHQKLIKEVNDIKSLRLKNQMALRTLYLKHFWLYYNTRLALNKLKND
jgi:glycosyltransferase involved in cell wall biosynthesis